MNTKQINIKAKSQSRHFPEKGETKVDESADWKSDKTKSTSDSSVSKTTVKSSDDVSLFCI